jgi:hypothetical protein
MLARLVAETASNKSTGTPRFSLLTKGFAPCPDTRVASDAAKGRLGARRWCGGAWVASAACPGLNTNRTGSPSLHRQADPAANVQYAPRPTAQSRAVAWRSSLTEMGLGQCLHRSFLAEILGRRTVPDVQNLQHWCNHCTRSIG